MGGLCEIKHFIVTLAVISSLVNGRGREATVSACEEENDIIKGLNVAFGKYWFCDGVHGELKKGSMCVLEMRGARRSSLVDRTQRHKVLTRHTGYGKAGRNDEVIVRREK